VKLFIFIALYTSALIAQEIPEFGPPAAPPLPHAGRITRPVADEEPSLFLTFGLGASQFSDPRYGFTGSIGKRIAGGTYATVALDFGLSAVNPATGQRKLISTLRPGLQRVLAKSGPITLTVAADIGGTVGPDALVGQVSGGGALVYELPKHPNLFLFGSLRIIKTPQGHPTLTNPAIVQTAASLGIGFRLK